MRHASRGYQDYCNTPDSHQIGHALLWLGSHRVRHAAVVSDSGTIVFVCVFAVAPRTRVFILQRKIASVSSNEKIWIPGSYLCPHTDGFTSLSGSRECLPFLEKCSWFVRKQNASDQKQLNSQLNSPSKSFQSLFHCQN